MVLPLAATSKLAMDTQQFDIIDFISGLTGFVFDKAVLNNIALQRGVRNLTVYSQLDRRTIDLLRADCLYAAYCSPNTMASHTHSHGSFSQSFGHQTITDKESLYEMFMSIYKKYDDPMLETIAGEKSTLQWLDL